MAIWEAGNCMDLGRFLPFNKDPFKLWQYRKFGKVIDYSVFGAESARMLEFSVTGGVLRVRSTGLAFRIGSF